MANGYYFFTGDYLRDTIHLGWLEDLAYRRLIDLYYLRGRPLPNDRAYLLRAVRANEPEQQAAVDTVLAEFFTLRTDGWHQPKCDERLKIETWRSRQASDAAKKRWSKENNSLSDADGNADGNAPFPTLPKAFQNTTYSGAETPFDPDREIWRLGLEVLMTGKIPERQARAIIGKHYKRNKARLLEVLCDMAKAPVIDPVPYLEAALNPKRGHDKVVL